MNTLTSKDNMMSIVETIFKPLFQDYIEEIQLKKEVRPIHLSYIVELHSKLQTYLSEYMSSYTDEQRELFFLYALNRTIRNMFRDQKHPRYTVNNMVLNKALSAILLPFFVKYCQHVRSLFLRLIREVIEEKYRISPHLMERFFAFYEREVYEIDLLTYMIVTIVYKYDPRIIENLSAFYADVLRKVINFQLLGKLDKFEHINLQQYLVGDAILVPSVTIDPQKLYEVLYLQLYCQQVEKSFLIQSVANHFAILKEVAIPNELRQMLAIAQFDSFKHVDYTHRDLLTFLWAVFINKDTIVTLKRKYPDIYRILRAVQVYSKVKSIQISEVEIQKAVERWIKTRFLHYVNPVNLNDLASKLSHRFAEQFCTGEYIDLVTLDTVYITNPLFTNQLLHFLDDAVLNLGTGHTRKNTRHSTQCRSPIRQTGRARQVSRRDRRSHGGHKSSTSSDQGQGTEK